MNKLEVLARRRELAVLSAQMQRAAIVARLHRLHTNPKRAVLDFAVGLLKRPAVRAAALVAVGGLIRKLSRRRRP